MADCRELADAGEKMSYQAEGLQLSLLIHAAIFLLITRTGISESRFNTLPVVIDLGIIREAYCRCEKIHIPSAHDERQTRTGKGVITCKIYAQVISVTAALLTDSIGLLHSIFLFAGLLLTREVGKIAIPAANGHRRSSPTY